MKTHKMILLFFFLLPFIKTVGQTKSQTFKLVDSIILIDQNSKILFAKLNTLKSKFIPSRSNISLSFNRDIDCNFRHNRINLELNFDRFQIDLLTRNDSIVAKTIRQYYNPFDRDKTTLNFDTAYSRYKIDDYLTQRNKLYKSKKTTSDIIKEISVYRVFAFYCGDGSPLTEEGQFIKDLVSDENIDELYIMLQSICVETQAYGVSGFKMLVNNGVAIPTDASKIIEHLKKAKFRNSNLQWLFDRTNRKIYDKSKLPCC